MSRATTSGIGDTTAHPSALRRFMCDDTVRMRCCIHDGMIVPGAPFNVMLIPWFFHSSKQQTFCAVYFLLADRSNPRGLYLNPNTCSIWCYTDTQVHLARLLSHTLLLLTKSPIFRRQDHELLTHAHLLSRRPSTIPHAIRCQPSPTPATLLTPATSRVAGNDWADSAGGILLAIEALMYA